MDYVKIGGKVWDVLVMEIEESFEKLYTDNSGRTLAKGAPMTLDCLGTFYTHSVTFKRKKGHEEEFDELYTYLAKPSNDGFDVDMVHNQTTIHYRAYCSSGSRKILQILKKIGLVNWSKMTIKFIPMKAQETL